MHPEVARFEPDSQRRLHTAFVHVNVQFWNFSSSSCEEFLSNLFIHCCTASLQADVHKFAFVIVSLILFFAITVFLNSNFWSPPKTCWCPPANVVLTVYKLFATNIFFYLCFFRDWARKVYTKHLNRKKNRLIWCGFLLFDF